MTTTTYHPPIYYTVRSVVRWVFWSAVLFGSMVLFSRCTQALRGEPCDLDLYRNFTWSSVEKVDVSECVAPNNVLLHQDGTWEWEN